MIIVEKNSSKIPAWNKINIKQLEMGTMKYIKIVYKRNRRNQNLKFKLYQA